MLGMVIGVLFVLGEGSSVWSDTASTRPKQGCTYAKTRRGEEVGDGGVMVWMASCTM
jgi:hypothetical protein